MKITDLVLYIITDEEGYYKISKTINISERLKLAPQVIRWWPIPNLRRFNVLRDFLVHHKTQKFMQYITWEGIFLDGKEDMDIIIPNLIRNEMA